MIEPSSPLRVLLVRPSGRFVSLRFPDGPMVAPPRSLLHLAAAVHDDPRFEVRILDALAHPDIDAMKTAPRPFRFGLTPEEVARRAASWPADVVGISTMAAYYRVETQEIVRAVREVLPRAFVLLGGPDPTVDAERYLAEAPADAVCIGEGEATFAELLDRLIERRPWHDVEGVAWRDGLTTRRSPARAALTDLDATVPDYGLVDLERYFALASQGWRSRPTFVRPGIERTVDVVTSRGCPYRCTFCVIHTTMGRRFRTLSIPAVVDHLRVLVHDHGVQHVHLEDDIVNLDRKRFAALLQAIVDARLPLTWDTPNGVRADLLDPDLVTLCRQAGCVYLIFGVESGSQVVLDEIVDKEMRLEHIVDAARACDQAGLDALAFYIIGMPSESLAQAEETMAFAFELLRQFGTTPILQVWRPYMQTALFDRAQEAGALQAADPGTLHRESGIPYTQFHERSMRHAELPIEALSELYARYGRMLAQEQLARWRRAGERVPVDLRSGMEHHDIEQFVLFEAPYLHAHQRARALRG